MADLTTEIAAADAKAQAKMSPAKTLGKLADLLEKSGIDIEDVARVDKIRVNTWNGFYKDEDGEAQTVDLEAASILLTPQWADGPQWPVIQPGPSVKVTPAKVKKTETGPWKTAVILPDMQIGYFRNAEDELVPTHDEVAINVARQVLKAAKPDLVVLVGDNLDMPEMGKYRLSPAYQRTTQASIDRATVLMAELRADAGEEAEIVWLSGNHEARATNYMIDNAVAAFGLRQGNVPESWPVLSVPHLCRLDEVNITYEPAYPANEYFINDRLRVIHGTYVTSKGSTAHKYLADERTSVIYGHIHRREWAEKTRHTRYGPRTIMAASPGCLCKTTGAVPSTKGGIDLDGRPVKVTEDWQQGLAVVQYQEGDGPFVYEQLAIHDGWAMWRGKEFQGA